MPSARRHSYLVIGHTATTLDAPMWIEPGATAAVPSSVRGKGILECCGTTTEVSYNLVRDKYDHASPWRLEAIARSHDELSKVFGAGSVDEPISLRGSVGLGGTTIHIPRVPLPRAENEVLEADVWRFELEEGERETSPAQWSVSVYLTPNPLAPAETSIIRDPRGFHEEHGERTPPIRWETEAATINYSRRLAFENVRVGETVAQLHVPYSSLRFAFHGGGGSHAAEALDQAESYASSLLRLLGYLARRRTMWTKMVAFPTEPEKGSWFRSKRYQMAGDRSTEEHISAFLSPNRFAVAVADGLVERFMLHQFRDTIEGCIDVLHASRENTVNFGFHKFISAFTAFEMITTAYSGAVGLGDQLRSGVQKRLLRHVRRAVDDFAVAERLAEGVAHSVKERAPELCRPSFAERAGSALTSAGIMVEDLFPAGTDTAMQLRRIAKLRNALVHSGRDVPISRAYPDGARLNLLTERLIYAWIGGKQEWVSSQERRDNAWLQEQRTL
jgi:hypothetical protein